MCECIFILFPEYRRPNVHFAQTDYSSSTLKSTSTHSNLFNSNFKTFPNSIQNPFKVNSLQLFNSALFSKSERYFVLLRLCKRYFFPPIQTTTVFRSNAMSATNMRDPDWLTILEAMQTFFHSKLGK